MPKLFSEVEELKDMDAMIDDILHLVSSDTSRERLRENVD
jgi:hypothetical protein